MATAGLRTQEHKNARTQEKQNGELGEHIREWAKRNDWYRVDIQTNQLRLEQTFGQTIEAVARKLETQNQHRMSRQVFDCYDLLSAKCRKIDLVCRNGCQSEAEMLELEFLRGKAVAAAAELAEVIEVINRTQEPTNTRTIEPPAVKRSKTDPSHAFGMTHDEWITFADTVEILGFSKPTLCRWADEGKIQCNGKTGRHRRLNKVSILLAKQAMEDKNLKKDVRELREDARKL